MTDTTAEEGVYRKTATIKATQWFKMGDHPAVVLKSARNRYADEGVPWVDTLEGGHVVTPGDWIATGVQGEHWPIKPDVFAATYAEVSEPSTTDPVSPLTAALHPKTTDLVNSFAIALAHKLLGAEEKYGYSDGWLTDDWEDKCRADLLAHVHKGDPLDVAAYAAFCWARNWSTAQPLATAQTDGIKDPFLREVQKQLRAKDRLAAQPSAGAQEIVWVRSGADVNGDPLTLKTTFGDMDVNVVKSRGTGLWNVSGYILGKMGIATEAEAVAYAEDRLRSDADRRVRAAHKAISLYATPAQPDTGDVAALREALEWLEWVRPKAVSAMEDHRCLRVKAGHDMKGTYRSGTTYVGLYQSEVDEIEGSADFIVNLRNRVAALSKPNAQQGTINHDNKDSN